MHSESSHPDVEITADKKVGLAYWAERVLEECDKASHDFAADPVHDLRVAIRRCRSMADGFRSVDPDPAWRQMKKLGKGLFSSLGELRDTQVMMEWIAKLSAKDDPLRQILLDSLQKKEAELKLVAKKAVDDFDRKRWMALNTRLAERATRVPLDGPVFQYLALERWHDAYELHRTALRNRSAVAYHQLRIGIKRFRYTVENFLPELHQRWSRDLRDLQDVLGEVHDFDVLWAMVRAHAEVGLEERALWQKTIFNERQKRIAHYRKKMLGKKSLWQKWRAELPAGESLAGPRWRRCGPGLPFSIPTTSTRNWSPHLRYRFMTGWCVKAFLRHLTSHAGCLRLRRSCTMLAAERTAAATANVAIV